MVGKGAVLNKVGGCKANVLTNVAGLSYQASRSDSRPCVGVALASRVTSPRRSCRSPLKGTGECRLFWVVRFGLKRLTLGTTPPHVLPRSLQQHIELTESFARSFCSAPLLLASFYLQLEKEKTARERDRDERTRGAATHTIYTPSLDTPSPIPIRVQLGQRSLVNHP